MGIISFIVELYIGKELVSREQMMLPLIIAIQQASAICMQLYEEKQPIKAIFINSDGDKLEYRNPAFIKFEGGN